MAFEYEIDTGRRLVVQRYGGPIGAAELLDGIDRVLSDARMSAEVDGLADFSGATLDLNFEDVSALVGRLRLHPKHSRGRWAFITSTPSNFGILRMFEQLAGDMLAEVGFFTTERQAREWLG